MPTDNVQYNTSAGVYVEMVMFLAHSLNGQRAASFGDSLDDHWHKLEYKIFAKFIISQMVISFLSLLIFYESSSSTVLLLLLFSGNSWYGNNLALHI